MDKHMIVPASLLIGCLLFFASLFTGCGYETSEYWEVHKARVPFGTFLSSGGGSFIFGTGGFSVSTEEMYLVKYFDGIELKTLTLNADEVSLIIDGTLQLELIRSYRETKLFFVFNTVDRRPWEDRYRIHIPFLPEANQTMNEDWAR